jgi:hypothetical protein
MRFEAAHALDSIKSFQTLREALLYIEGSPQALTRPWVRVVPRGSVPGAYLISAGKKVENSAVEDSMVKALAQDERLLLARWRHVDLRSKPLIDELRMAQGDEPRPIELEQISMRHWMQVQSCVDAGLVHKLVDGQGGFALVLSSAVAPRVADEALV